jgi:hypothetical protein
MRYVGLAYLLGFVGDGALSMLAIAVPSVEGVSDTFSAVMFVFSAIVLVLAIMGRLKPRIAFLAPVGVYAAFTVVAMALVAAMLVKTGGRSLPDELSLQYVVAVLPWFGPLNWVLLASMMAIGTACLYKFVSTLTEDVASPDGLS